MLLAGCDLPTLIEPGGREKPPAGASLFVVNSSHKVIEKITVWKTLLQGWDPDYQMAQAQRAIQLALARRGRLADSEDKAGLIVRIDPPRPESDGVFEEVKIVDPRTGRELADVNKKGDNWDEAIEAILNWIDGITTQQKEDRHSHESGSPEESH